jgi:hypothetical protein
VDRVAALIGRTPGSVEWLLKKNGLKKNDHRKPRTEDAEHELAATRLCVGQGPFEPR